MKLCKCNFNVRLALSYSKLSSLSACMLMIVHLKQMKRGAEAPLSLEKFPNRLVDENPLGCAVIQNDGYAVGFATTAVNDAGLNRNPPVLDHNGRGFVSPRRWLGSTRGFRDCTIQFAHGVCLGVMGAVASPPVRHSPTMPCRPRSACEERCRLRSPSRDRCALSMRVYSIPSVWCCTRYRPPPIIWTRSPLRA